MVKLSHLWPSEDVEEEVDVGPVEDGEAVEHHDLVVGLRRLREETFFEGRLKHSKSSFLSGKQ